MPPYATIAALLGAMPMCWFERVARGGKLGHGRLGGIICCCLLLPSCPSTAAASPSTVGHIALAPAAMQRQMCRRGDRRSFLRPLLWGLRSVAAPALTASVPHDLRTSLPRTYGAAHSAAKQGNQCVWVRREVVAASHGRPTRDAFADADGSLV